MRIITVPTPQQFFVYVIYKDKDVRFHVRVDGKECHPPGTNTETGTIAVFEIGVTNMQQFVELRGTGKIYAVVFSWWQGVVTQDFLQSFRDEDLTDISDGSLIIRP